MGVEKNVIDTNKINKQNEGDLYRPPALRTKANESVKKNIVVNDETVLNKSSSKKFPNTATTLQSLSYPNTTATLMSCNNSPMHRNENTNVNNLTTSIQQTTYKTHQQCVVDEQQKQLSFNKQQQQVRRERRPDRAVYIPRARRSQTTPPNTSTTQIQSPPQQQQQALSIQLPAAAPIPNNNTSKSLSQQLPITLDNTLDVLVKQKQSAKADEVSKINIIRKNTHNKNIRTAIKKKEKLSTENKDSSDQGREQEILKNISIQHINNISENCEKPSEEDCLCTITSNDDEDHSVNNFSEFYDNLSKGFNCDNCERFNINQELLETDVQSLPLFNLIKQESNESANIINSIVNNIEMTQSVISSNYFPKSTTDSDNIIETNTFITSSNNNNNINNTMPKTANKNKTNKMNSEMVDTYNKSNNLRIEDIQSQQSTAKCDIEELELQRASKEINRSNRRIIKQTFLSDVLHIPDSIDEEKSEREAKVSIVSKTSANVPTLKTQVDNNTEEEEDDDWESMYNESGDCLDPKIIQELTTSVGKCKIELPRMDYSAYLTKQSILNEEEFPHVLEVSNFPVEFKNQDLLMVFSQYKESGFDIKWVDDTHALAVFSSSRIAAEVLTMGHPFVVLKPLAEATMESRLKAKKCAASLQPYRPRPETCAALARRLVTGALGVRLKTAAAERENEKRVLREAKERKLLAAKQRDEVWES